MSLHDFLCCHGNTFPTDECPSCPFAPRVPGRREISIEHVRRLAEAEFDEISRRAMTEGAHSALALVEIGLERGLTVQAAIECARAGTEVWTQP